MSERNPGADTTTREVVITRIFDAPRDLVWRAWTEPEHLTRWFGPRTFTTPVYNLDLRVGGEIHSCMRSPDGHEFWSKGTYREIVPPERLVMTDSFADAQGNVVPASYYGMDPNWPLEMLVTVTFEEQDGKTRLTLTHSGVRGVSDQDLGNMEQGWSESFDKLAEYLGQTTT